MTKPRTAVAALWTRPGPEVLLVQRGADSTLAHAWAFPGGHLEEGERLERGMLRELLEETRLCPDVSQAELVPAGIWRQAEFVRRDVDVHLYAFHTDEETRPRPRAEGDAADARWWGVDEVLAAWDAGEVTLPASVLAVLRGVSAGADIASLPGADATPLPRHEIVRGVSLVPQRTPTLPPATHTNAYILGTGPERVIVDPASPWADARARVDQVVDALAEEGARITAIWLTHHHQDHVSGAAFLRDRLGVPILAHPKTPERVDRGLVDQTVEPGTAFPLEGPHPQRWRAIDTPGHTWDHLCFHDELGGAVICGDLMAGIGTIVIDPPEGNMAAYFRSLEKVRDLKPSSLFPSHGPPSLTPVRHIEMYLAHRKMREDAIVDGLAHGDTEVDALVKRVYTDVPMGMHPLARRNVEAHLEKLEEEGRVTADRAGYHLAG